MHVFFCDDSFANIPHFVRESDFHFVGAASVRVCALLYKHKDGRIAVIT